MAGKASNKNNKLLIRLVKSPIGSIPSHRSTLRALGLGKVNSSVIQSASAPILGMVRAVNHLVTCEEIRS